MTEKRDRDLPPARRGLAWLVGLGAAAAAIAHAIVDLVQRLS